MNGKQRNFYLDYLKKHYPNDWCLVLDADEIVDDIGKVKDFIQDCNTGLYNVKMRHFIGDLGNEDATKPIHHVPNRLFKISEAESYPLHSHPVLEGKEKHNGETVSRMTDCTTIWHLGHLPIDYMDYVVKRYNEHKLDSKIHTQEFLKGWKNAHLFGKYPKSEINPVELPKQLLDRFDINKDEFYFANRGLELKHFLMAKQWLDFCKLHNANPISMIEFGCGRSPYGLALESYGVRYEGVELSQYAVDNAFTKITQGNILDYKSDRKNELAIAFDVLEHLEYEDLDKAIDNLIDNTYEKILISVPVLGDPNLLLDSTHIIKETKDWWISKFLDKGLKQVEVPSHFLYRSQLMIFEK